jgi:hypothetical protein
MPSLAEVFASLCQQNLIPAKRQKDVKTAVRYLAAAHGCTPEQVMLVPELEATYAEPLRDYLRAQDKSPFTIRNAIQGVGQCLRAYHQLVQTPPVLTVATRRPQYKPALRQMAETSPYKHSVWMAKSRYCLPVAQWPADVRAGFEQWLTLKRDDLRAITKHNLTQALTAYVGFLAMPSGARLDHLHPDSRAKLMRLRYRDDLATISAPPVFSSWDDLFAVDAVRGFVTWHAWRIHTPQDAKVVERSPSIPSTTGLKVTELVTWVAEALQPASVSKPLREYRSSLDDPIRIHDKGAPYHQFTRAEIDRVGQQIIEEARRMNITKQWTWRSRQPGRTAVQYPGAHAAARFQLGLILRLGWRIPLRIRNWCEMLLDRNLRKVNRGWQFHFEGSELKVAKRRGEANRFTMDIDQDIVPVLEEFLTVWRPKLPHADEDRHVFLGAHGPRGGRLEETELSTKIRVHVYRLTGKLLNPHLLRTIFMTELFSSGVDLNTIAYGLNDNPMTVVLAYNEFQAGKHQLTLHEANRRALLKDL